MTEIIKLSDGQSITVERWRVANGCGDPAMIAAAQSFAGLTGLVYWIYQYQSGDAGALPNVAGCLRDHCLHLVELGKLKRDLVDPVVWATVEELQHPFTERPLSGRCRAIAGGVSKDKWHRAKLCDVVNRLLKLTDQSLEQAERLIKDQIIEAI